MYPHVYHMYRYPDVFEFILFLKMNNNKSFKYNILNDTKSTSCDYNTKKLLLHTASSLTVHFIIS